ncbi:hypothetical protein MN116_002527 [Schistosoma mekongi]|uniref:protein-tyrosine-phosphatase n=1 Tax=Schistosoma mekongi TaxID=38744 RepID=A0AAE1ZLI3_SCHME|nr:hypothetical protein MN116_002527 [Schistosoma mekongi]
MDEIVSGVWLGPMPFAENIPVLKRNGILSILTLDIMPLDCNVFKEFHMKFLYLRDEPSQDLLEILEDALNFINESIQNKSDILVHCAMGVSRSASVVIAYLMRQNHLSYEEAYNIVSRKRSIFPNNGFINQLKLFHAMNWTVDRDSPLFRQYIAKRNFSVFTVRINMDEIVSGVWLGPMPFAENIPVLKRNGILSILTLDIMPLDCNVFKEFHMKFLYLRDEPSQDLLEILEDALNFINESIQNKSDILVHCAMGVSRSASVVIAYLMRQNHLSYEEAYNIVSRKRSIFPNNGFINQLKLFHAMNWTVDRDSPLFRQYIAKRNFSVFTGLLCTVTSFYNV